MYIYFKNQNLFYFSFDNISIIYTILNTFLRVFVQILILYYYNDYNAWVLKMMSSYFNGIHSLDNNIMVYERFVCILICISIICTVYLIDSNMIKIIT